MILYHKRSTLLACCCIYFVSPSYHVTLFKYSTPEYKSSVQKRTKQQISRPSYRTYHIICTRAWAAAPVCATQLGKHQRPQSQRTRARELEREVERETERDGEREIEISKSFVWVGRLPIPLLDQKEGRARSWVASNLKPKPVRKMTSPQQGPYTSKYNCCSSRVPPYTTVVVG